MIKFIDTVVLAATLVGLGIAGVSLGRIEQVMKDLAVESYRDGAQSLCFKRCLESFPKPQSSGLRLFMVVKFPNCFLHGLNAVWDLLVSFDSRTIYKSSSSGLGYVRIRNLTKVPLTFEVQSADCPKLRYQDRKSQLLVAKNSF